MEWAAVVARMEGLGYRPVKAFNQYWDRQGRTFEDPDGYSVVLQNAGWDNEPKPSAKEWVDGHAGH